MELKKITEQVFYIQNSMNFGVVKYGESSAILIDTGFDDDAGKKILRVLEENGLSVKTIINTHSHADHCGGNKYIKERTGATIYAPELESAIIEYPLLEPLCFFSGAHPIKDLQHKFYMAAPSDVDYVIKKAEKKIKIGKVDLDILLLPGHAANQIGIAVDDILFCADSVFYEKILENSKIPFIMDVDGAKETLKLIRNTKYQ